MNMKLVYYVTINSDRNKYKEITDALYQTLVHCMIIVELSNCGSHCCLKPCCSYFVLPAEKLSVEQEEAVMHTDKGAYCMAHNGWVMSDDPLRNFAEPGQTTLISSYMGSKTVL